MANKAVIDILTRDRAPTPVDAIKTITGVERRQGLEETPGQEFLIGAGRRLTEIGQAGKQLALSGAEKLGAVPEGTSQAYTNKILEEANLYASTPVADSGWATAGSVMTDIVTSLPALSVAAPLSTASLTLTGAARVGAFEGLSRPAYSQQDTQLFNSERILNVTGSVLASVAAGAIASKLLPATAMTIQEKMIGAPFNMIKKKAVGDLEGTAVKEGIDAAKKLNMFITPGEASKDLIHRQIEADMLLFPKAKRELYTKILEREDRLQSELTSIIRGLVPEGEVAARTAAKDLAVSAYSTPVPSALFTDLVKQTPIFNKALKAARGSGNTELLRRAGGIAPIQANTVGELHLMRLAIDDLITKAKSGRGKYSYASLVDNRKQLVSIADWFAPEYAMSRSINQRLIIQNEWQNVLDTTKITGRASNTFYKNFLETPEKFDDLMQQVERISEPSVRNTIKKNIEVMATFLRKINDSPIDEAIGLSTREVRATARGVGGLRGIMLNAVSTVADGTLDKHVMRFITSPDWYDEFSKRAANGSTAHKNRVVLGLFYDYLARTSPATAAALQSQIETEKLRTGAATPMPQ